MHRNDRRYVCHLPFFESRRTQASGRIEFHRTVLRHSKDTLRHGTVVPSRRQNVPHRPSVHLQCADIRIAADHSSAVCNRLCGRLGKDLAESRFRKDERCMVPVPEKCYVQCVQEERC